MMNENLYNLGLNQILDMKNDVDLKTILDLAMSCNLQYVYTNDFIEELETSLEILEISDKLLNMILSTQLCGGDEYKELQGNIISICKNSKIKNDHMSYVSAIPTDSKEYTEYDDIIGFLVFIKMVLLEIEIAFEVQRYEDNANIIKGDINEKR